MPGEAPEAETARRLVDALDDVIVYFAREYHVTVATAVGCLEMVKIALINDANDAFDEGACDGTDDDSD